MAKNFTEIAYSDAVLAMQRKYKAVEINAELQHSVGRNSITPALASYLSSRVSFYMATASKAAQPYIQHRGGPAGFIKILDPQTLAFADFDGNKQYISLGNLSENPRVQLFFMDYSQRRRLKIWGTAKLVEDDPKLLAAVTPEAWRKPLRRAIRITVEAWDVNCPAYIPQLFSVDDVEAAHAGMLKHIEALEAEIERLKREAAKAPTTKPAAANARARKR
ncbi:pyridoxamine 5'-phosphate oxidase family protein [Dongia soli]|uniref:Pyridoxamine 5'-phosphate oxidase family protein n=1 Tax=Dongia soli TaxID=600628 RepID=A0ABU5E4S3_9PROT|nr:pyridoxamine 5'-phosphate oxidase family protein [Dongia soli]MDY0881312.1 pyridoxamine 5'-phosphate oxidase family protein [Dongia soli]